MGRLIERGRENNESKYLDVKIKTSSCRQIVDRR